MSDWRQQLVRLKSLNYVLAAGVLFLALVPFHLHLHQDTHEAVLGHGGSIDIHVTADIAHQAHHDHVVIMKVAPDALTAFIADNPLPFILLGFVLMVLPVVMRVRPLTASQSTRTHFRISPYSNPPLRAPPQY